MRSTGVAFAGGGGAADPVWRLRFALACLRSAFVGFVRFPGWDVPSAIAPILSTNARWDRQAATTLW